MSNKMWGGRFGSDPDPIMEEINASIDFDRHLYRQDIAASKAHAAMLAKTGIIAAKDAKQIAQGLDTILSEIEAGKFEFRRALEDIHMNVESRLAELIGPAAGRLHTARSRNDQVATDFRLWVRDAIDGHRRGAGGLPARARGEGARACGDGDAGLHPSADRPAGHVRPSPSRLCRDGGARPRPFRRCAPAPQRKPARRCGACRHLVSDRSRDDREGARLRPADGEFARRRRGSRFRAGNAGGGARSPPCICRASPRRSCCGRRRSSVCCGFRTSSPPAPRSCRRSAIPTRPNSCARAPAVSSAR